VTARRATTIPWLRGMDLPASWSETKVKYLAPGMRAGETITAEDIEKTGTFPVYGGNGLRGYTEAHTHSGTRLLIGRQGALCGNVHLVSGDFWASEHAIVAESAANVDPRWLAHLLRVMNLGQHSMSSAQPGIGTSQINALAAPLPSSEVQRAIADYLDRETAQIDTLIAEQERLIDLLRERRDAVGAQFFASNSGKRMTTVRRVLRPLARPAVSGLGVITAYRDGVVTLRSNRRDDGYTFSDTEHGYQEIRPGDLVFHALDGFAGAIGISDSQGNATPVYHVCEATNGDDPAYVAMLLRYLGVTGFLVTQAPNVRERSVDFRNWSMLARIPLALPTATEQTRAVIEIASQTAKIDALIAESERFIELARERRSALITAAVTGQIDVRAGGMTARSLEGQPCALCSNGVSTRDGEHVIPRWFLRLYLSAADGSYTTEVNGESVLNSRSTPRKHSWPEVRLPACENCNRALRDRFEIGASQGVVQNFFGAPFTFDTSAIDARLLGLWLLKTWVLLAHPKAVRTNGRGPSPWSGGPDLWSWTATGDEPPASLSLWINRQDINATAGGGVQVDVRIAGQAFIRGAYDVHVVALDGEIIGDAPTAESGLLRLWPPSGDARLASLPVLARDHFRWLVGSRGLHKSALQLQTFAGRTEGA